MYDMINGVEMNRMFPDTFGIPTKLEKALIEPGMYVKVGISKPAEDGITGERFWVLVTEYKWLETTQSGYGEGTIDNDLVVFPELNGTIIKFTTDHVLDILE